jgi:hypothetical protein
MNFLLQILFRNERAVHKQLLQIKRERSHLYYPAVLEIAFVFQFLNQCRECCEAGIRASYTEFCALDKGAAPGTRVPTKDMRALASV